MFGYVTVNRQELTREEYYRFRAVYCGLCRTLRRQFGGVGRMGLSFDMTFLAMLLNALYEPEEESGYERCALHPLRPHPYVNSAPFEYAADLNIALSYHKCLDNWADDKNPAAAAGAKLLERHYRAVSARRPEKCAAIEAWLKRQGEIEREGTMDVDLCANLTGSLLGELYAWKDDEWSEGLRAMGESMGRFIYFMDAYEDLPGDEKRNRFNPLRTLSQQEDYEAMCRDALTMFLADCAEQFEQLPILRDASILRNILYSGAWSRYAQLQTRRNKARGKGEKP